MYPKLTGRAVLDYLAELRGGVDRRVRDALVERFDADLDRPIRELSTGNRQKLGLIQAFMHEPELLILDEPIAGLDPLVQQSFHALLGEVSGQGRTVFLSSHTLSEVERVTHRLAILREGRLVVVDSLENLRKVAVQRLEIEFGAPVDAGEFRALPGVAEAKCRRRDGDRRLRGLRRRGREGRGQPTRCGRSARARTTSRTSSCATTERTSGVSWPTVKIDAAPAPAVRGVGRARADRGAARRRRAVPRGRALDRQAQHSQRGRAAAGRCRLRHDHRLVSAARWARLRPAR